MTLVGIVPPVVFTILLWITVMMVLARLYRRAPFKRHEPPKPSFVWFPKYEAVFRCSPEALRDSLHSLGFKSEGGDANVLHRGRWYGDFSLQFAKLKAEIDPDRSAVRLSTPWVALFDTGDFWQLMDDIVSASRDETPSR